MTWFPLALLCAFSLATADALTKKFLSDYTAQELLIVRFGFAAIVLAPFLWSQPLPAVPSAFWGWMVILAPLEILAMALYVLAIRDSPLSLTLPYLAFTPVFTTLTGFVVLGEQVSLRGFGGILLVTVGAYLLNVQHIRNNGEYRWLAPLRAVFRERGSRLMLAVAAIYSLTSVMGKAAMQYTGPHVFGPFYFCLIGAIAVVVFSARNPGNIRVLWRRPGWHLMIGIMMATMVLTHFISLAQVEAAYMIAVKRISLLFGIVYGALLFHEDRFGQNVLAGSLMVAGVALIVS